jgi:hypothetical protein
VLRLGLPVALVLVLAACGSSSKSSSSSSPSGSSGSSTTPSGEFTTLLNECLSARGYHPTKTAVGFAGKSPHGTKFTLLLYHDPKAAQAHGGMYVEFAHGVIAIVDTPSTSNLDTDESQQLYDCVTQADK